MTFYHAIRTLKLKTRIISSTRLLTIQTLIILFAVTCQDGAKQIVVNDESPTLYHLSGVVLDYQTNKPVSEITVKVVADSTYQTITDSTGHYLLILGAEPGVHEISFRGHYYYASMSGEVLLPDDSLTSVNPGKPALSPLQILVTNDVHLYPLTNQVSGEILGVPWDYSWLINDTICVLPWFTGIPIYISYTEVSPIGQSEVTLDCNLYTTCADFQDNYSFYQTPHTDSAIIGIIPFCNGDSCYYGSSITISLDNSESVDIQLVAAPMFDIMYAYRAFDTLHYEIVSGWLGMNDPDLMGQFTGAWSIRKNNCQPWPVDIGPQEGDGVLNGQIDGDKISIELNPDMADNNVTLVADTASEGLHGIWSFSTFVGEVNRGTFSTYRVNLGP